MPRRRALIATIPPRAGGVPVMVRAAVAFLAELEIDAELAWYEPYSLAPELSVPLTALGRRRVGSERVVLDGALDGTAIGAVLPEVEVTHYRATPPWRAAIERCDLHLAVSGTIFAARAFADSGTPFLAWVASDWWGDRARRVRSFPALRRIIDATVVRPLARRLEPRLLRSGAIVALSEPTRRALDRVAGRPVVEAVVPVPIDVDELRPDPTAVVPGRVGFAGRFDDPRKNFELFLDALALARRRDSSLTAEILGRAPDSGHLEAVERRGLTGAVRFAGELSRPDYVTRLRTFDLFCVTSHQEGLGIAALEAMASGVPVISTLCGGPEEFVRDGHSGFLTGFSAREIADRLVMVTDDRGLRQQLSTEARRTIELRYQVSAARAPIVELLGRPFPGATSLG